MPPQKHTLPVTVLARDGSDSGCNTLAEAIFGAWPDDQTSPDPIWLGIDEACMVGHAALDPVVLAIIDDTLSDRDVFRLADHLASEHVPGLLITDRLSDETVGRLHGSGVLTLSPSTDPVRIASAIHAIAVCGGAMRRIRSDLFTAERAQGGADGELQRLHEELMLASNIQRSFLPHSLPSVATLDFGVVYRPAGYVSGDIYDIRVLDEHRIGILVADAVGHGVPAALLTMILARSMAASVVDRSRVLAPSEVLRNINSELIAATGDEPRFASAMYGIIDTRDLVLTIAGAGHPAGLVIRGGEVHQIDSAGGLLGVFPEDAFDDQVVELAAGDTLALYSDGFETAFDDSGFHETPKPSIAYISRFERVAEQASQGKLQQAVRSLAHELDLQAGSLHQADDLTALFISACEESPLDELMRGRPARGAAASAPLPLVRRAV